MSHLQNIVVIGGSIAGHAFVNALVPHLPTTHRILLIDASDVAYWPLASLRAAVKEGESPPLTYARGWEDRVVAPLNTATVFPFGSVHQVVAPNKVVQLKEGSVVLEKPFEGSTEVPFAKCVIATGALQPSPMRAPLGATKDELLASLRKSQADIAKSAKVVIIGGGPVGLEIAGEIREKSADKQITVVHSETRLLNPTPNPNQSKSGDHWSSPSSHPKLSVALEKELQAMKIDTVLGDKVVIPSSAVEPGEWDGTFGALNSVKTVKLASGKTLEADYVFIGVGNKPNGGLVGQVDAAAVDGAMLRVDEYFQVKSDKLRNYFAIGDVSNTPGWKTAQTATADGEAAAQNVLSSIKSNTPGKRFQRSTMHGLIIPLGASRGAGAMTVPIFGTFIMPLFMIKAVKSSDLFVKQLFLARFKGAEPVVIPEVKA